MRAGLAMILVLFTHLTLSSQVVVIIEKLPPNTPITDTIFLAGSINNWETALPEYRFICRDSAGPCVLTLQNKHLDRGFEYKITRGVWQKVEVNELGQFVDNRKYTGPANGDTIILQIANWDDLPVNPLYGWARIVIDRIPKNTPNDASLYAVGNFNAWIPGDADYRLKKTPEGTYTIDLPILFDTTLYKFTRGNWETIEGRRNGRARVNRQWIRGENHIQPEIAHIETWEDLSGNPINAYTFFLLLAAMQGLLLILAINTSQYNNKAANRALSLLLLTLSIALVGRVSTYDREIFQWLPKLLLLPDFIYFLYAPIFFIYINRLLRLPSRQYLGISAWHFIPFVAQIAFYMPYILMDKEPFITAVVDQKLKHFFAWSAGIALIYNTIYWFVCRRTVRQYEQESGEKHAFESNLSFLNVIIWLNLVCLAIWASTYAAGLWGLALKKDLSFITDATTDALWIAFSLTAFLLGYFTMRQPEIFKLPAIEDTPSTQERDEEEEKAASMSPEEIAHAKEKLEGVMQEKQPYRNSGLSLNGLAEMTGVSPHSLSRVINEGYGMNFNDYVNSYRIQEFKRLVQLEEFQNHTLLAIAFEVGFNSKSAFNRSFKKLESLTPREYLKREVE